MTANDPEVRGENINGDASGIARTGEKGVADSHPDGTAMPQGNDRSPIATSTSFSPISPESNSATMLNEKRQFNLSAQGDPHSQPLWYTKSLTSRRFFAVDVVV